VAPVWREWGRDGGAGQRRAAAQVLEEEADEQDAAMLCISARPRYPPQASAVRSGSAPLGGVDGHGLPAGFAGFLERGWGGGANAAGMDGRSSGAAVCHHGAAIYGGGRALRSGEGKGKGRR